MRMDDLGGHGKIRGDSIAAVESGQWSSRRHGASNSSVSGEREKGRRNGATQFQTRGATGSSIQNPLPDSSRNS